MAKCTVGTFSDRVTRLGVEFFGRAVIGLEDRGLTGLWRRWACEPDVLLWRLADPSQPVSNKHSTLHLCIAFLSVHGLPW